MKKNKNILKRVEQYKYKRGISFADTDSASYKFMRVLATLSFAYLMFFNTMYILGQIFNFVTGQGERVNKNAFIAITISTAVIIIGYVLNCTRLRLYGSFTMILPAITNFIFFRHAFNPNASSDGVLDTTNFILGMPPRFYVRHFIPVVLLLIAAIVMIIIDIRARVKNNRLYNHIMESLYVQYRSGDKADMSEEEWQEFINSYEPSPYKKQFAENEENSSEEEETEDTSETEEI